MDNSMVRKTNALSTVISIYLPLIFILLNAIYIISFFGNSIIMIAILLILFVTGSVCYIGNIIQGLHAISNGKAGTHRNASLFQIILYLINSILSIIIMIQNRNNSSSFPLTSNRVFLVIFVIIIFLAVVRRAMLSKRDSNDTATLRNPGLARKIVLFFIILPILLFAVAGGLNHLLATNEALRRTLGIICAIVFLLFIIGFGIFIIGLLAGSPFIEDSSPVETRSPRPSAQPKEVADSSEKYVEMLDKHYEIEFKKITGRSPSQLDWKILKDGKELDAVKKLRREMQDEAKKKGVQGESKYF